MSTLLDPEQIANSLNDKGNALYGDKKFTQAIEKYREALKLSPNASKPSRNLSAAYFEAGDYERCIAQANEAIKLLKEEATYDNAIYEKLAQRISKAMNHISRYSEEDITQIRRKILDSVPKLRASMNTTTEPYTVGNDRADSLYRYDDLLEKHPRTKDDTISFLLGGVGDARHLYKTWINLAEQEKEGKAPQRSYHFTTNDINKCALTRDLIIWVLLDELTLLDQNLSDHEILSTIFFIYLPTIMPPYAYARLRKTISSVLKDLSTGIQPLKWVHLHEKDILSFIEVLNNWLGTGSGVFTTSEVIEGTVKALIRRHLEYTLGDLNTKLKQEKILYINCALLYPPKDILKVQEPRLLELLQTTLSRDNRAKKLREYLAENWKFNITMMDFDWYKDLLSKKREHDFDFANDPFEAIDHFEPFSEDTCSRPRNPSSLFDYMAPFFRDVVNALKYLNGRVKVEVMHGDVIEIAERLQLAGPSTQDRLINAGNPRPKEFPKQFDRIHLSNIPDYIGGHLSTFLFVMPILSRERASFLQSNCLRNSGSWDTVESFLADYQCITDKWMLARLTGVSVLRDADPELLFPMGGYQWYAWTTSSLGFSMLLPRQEFQKWLYSLFLRIALPFNVNTMSVLGIIFSPLNLTVMFRLMAQLHVLGYPSHWMSEVLLNIIENNIITSCRPPRMSPTTVTALKLVHKNRKICTSPFSDEVATLTQMFHPLLPFVVTSPSIPSENHVYRYTYSLRDVNPYHDQPSNLVLIFWNDDLLMELGDLGSQSLVHNLRPLLDPTWGDEMDRKFKGTKFEHFREKGIIVWSTIDWNIPEQEASVWMPSTLVDRLKSEKWHCGLSRTDTWQRCWMSPEVLGIDTVRRGESWL